MEGGVLLRVQGFQQGAGRVSLEIRRQFVNLVQDNHRIGGAGALDAVQDTARKGTHIGFAVTANLGLVVHAAQGYPYIFAPERASDALAKGGFTYSGRAPQAQDGRLHVALELEDRKVFDDTVFHLVQTKVVLVQHLLRMLQVQVVVRQLSPGQVQHELDVRILDAVVRRSRVVFLQAGHFLVEDGTHFL